MLELVLQLAVGVVMVLAFAAVRVTQRAVLPAVCRACYRRRPAEPRSAPQLQLPSAIDRMGDTAEQHAVTAGAHKLWSQRSVHSDYDALDDDTVDAVHTTRPRASCASTDVYNDAVAMTPRARYVAAALNWALTVYATLTLCCMKLLHCVQLDDTRVLFIQGSVTCDVTVGAHWQAGLVVVVVLLGVTPVVALPLLTRWALTAGGSSAAAANKSGGGLAHSSDSSPTAIADSDVRVGVLRSLVGPYRAGVWYWESVLMVQRLLLALLATFGASAPAMAALAQCGVCLACWGLHCALAPLRDGPAGALQTTLQLCLTVVAVASVPTATVVAEGTSTLTAQLADVVDGMQLCCGAAVPVVAVALAFAVPWLRQRCRLT